MAAFAVLLILAGTVLVYLGFRSKWQENSVQKQLRAVYTDRLASGQSWISQIEETERPEKEEGPAQTDPVVLPGDDEEPDQVFDINRLRPMGILKIPKIKIEAVMVEGVTPNDLRYAVGHFTGTGLPGRVGNLAIAGHRNFITGDFFGHLDKVEPGDELIVEFDGQTYIYIVSEIFVVKPEDTWVLDPASYPQITLVTCTPPRISSHRLIVRGTLRDTP
ncbi:MAG TPA: class D sortase [Bacillota bacterium]|nr:class D sortase [Bacillota bacterium]HQB80537.1 class D sortase [Bacillota bacterium]